MAFNFLSSVGNTISGIAKSTTSLRLLGNSLRGLTLKNMMNGCFAHEYSSGASIKGALANLETGETKQFQYNPRGSEFTRTVNFATVTSPGMPYPLSYYVNGGLRTFSVELFMYDRPTTGAIVQYRKFIETMLPPENNKDSSYKKPPEVLYSYGGECVKCVIEEFKYKVEDYAEDGTPYLAKLSLKMRLVSR